MTDPYQSPETSRESRHPASAGKLICGDCRSPNLGRETITINQPSILWLMFFGWIYLLLRAAFGKKTLVCSDCGAITSYRGAANWLALTLIVVLIGVVLVAFIQPS